MYRASRIRRHRRWERVASGPFALFFFAASLARIAEGGPLDKVNVRRSGDRYVASVDISATLGAGAVAGFVCEPIVGALVLPIGDTIAVFGGFDGNPLYTNFAVTEFYHPATDSWSAAPAMNQAASEMAQGATFNSTQIFAVGTGIRGVSGSVVQALNCEPPQASAWKKFAPFMDPRTTDSGVEGAAASLIADKIYVSHGRRGPVDLAFHDTAFLSIYDIVLGSWTHGGLTAPDASFARSELAGGTALGKHYAIGGRPATDVVEAFDPVTSTWTTVASLNTARAGLGAASWNGRIYAVGGRTGSTFGTGTILGVNEVYDPIADTWTVLAPMPTPLSDVYATIALNGKVYVLGGAIDPVTVTGAVQIYDIATDSWSFGAPMPTPRAAAMAGICGDPVTIDIDDVTQDESPAVLDTDVDDEPLLAKALQNAQLFDPDRQDLFFFHFHPNWPCPRPTVVEVTFRVRTGQYEPVDLVRFTGGATNQSDIDDHDDVLTNFKTVDELIVVAGACCNTLTGGCTEVVIASECSGAQRNWTEDANCADLPCDAVPGACCDQDPFGGCSETSQAECTCDQCVWHELLTCADIECSHNPIPTTSEWGLVVMTLVLLTGAKVYFGRRSEMGSP